MPKKITAIRMDPKVTKQLKLLAVESDLFLGETIAALLKLQENTSVRTWESYIIETLKETRWTL